MVATGKGGLEKKNECLEKTTDCTKANERVQNIEKKKEKGFFLESTPRRYVARRNASES